MALNRITQIPFKVWEIDYLSDFVRYIQENCSIDEFVIFRGQREDKDLLPKIGRPNFDGIYDDMIDTEKEMIDTFCREAPPLLNIVPQNMWEWLAVAQHHGLPTRLLDWTQNAFSGLWFAVRKQAKTKKSKAVVWVYKPVRRFIFSSPPELLPFNIQQTSVYIPKHVSLRLIAQEGLFTVHKHSERTSGFVPLQKISSQRKRLEKIRIKPNRLAELRYNLHRCGIHASSMFPDVDGLAKRIEAKNTYLYDDERALIDKDKF